MKEHMRAGTGRVEITCREDVTLDALLSEKSKKDIPPELLGRKLEVSDPLFVRALVLDDGCEKIVLITMDVTAIGARTISQNILCDSADDFLPKVRRRIEEEFNIPGGNVSVSASHTHGVPRMLCDDAAQVARTVEAVAQAMRAMVPVTFGIGAGREDTLTFNRTMMMKDGTDYTLRGCNPPPPDSEVAGLRPIDPEIGILRVDRLDGSPLAIVYNFASHLLLGPPAGKRGRISADHVGVTLNYLEENLGGGATAFFLQGAGGDIAEVSKCDTAHPRSAYDFGTRLGQSIMRSYRSIKTGAAKIKTASKLVRFPLRRDIPEVIAALKKEQAALLAALRYTSLNFKGFLPLYLNQGLFPGYPSHWAYRYMQADSCGDIRFRYMDDKNRLAVAKYLDSLSRMERMARNEEKIATLERHREIISTIGGATVPAEIMGIRIGECVFIAAPMEILAEIGFNVKKASPFKHTYIASISNGYLHYAPPASYYPRGGYEVTECLLAPEWEKVFEKAVAEIFEEIKPGR